MFSVSDTIVAIATPPGRGGIGVVRVSGPDALAIGCGLVAHVGELKPRYATLTRVLLRPNATDAAIDQVVATFFPAPHSYTGDDVLELSAHGSPVVLRTIVSSAIAAGARLAEPGEFTLRAFLNGRIDLVQAEAVADLIDAVTPLQARTAFDQLEGTLTRVIGEVDASVFDLIARLEASVDFPDEGYHFIDREGLVDALGRLCDRTTTLLGDARRGRLVREGFQVAIVGKPNVGKSSLFNTLVGAERAIVTEVPGTTRDLVTEIVDLDGLRVTLVDTAGRRDARDVVEAEGVQRSKQAAAVSDLVLVVLDGSCPLEEADLDIVSQAIDFNRLIVKNKSDLAPAWHDERVVCVSTASGEGVDRLRQRIASALDVDLARDRPSITNERHIALLRRAHEALDRARLGIETEGASMSEEFVLADLQDARAALEEISGRRAPEDLLNHIFARFCVGK